MPRVLVCVDEVPASNGSCAVQAWQEVPSLLPPMSLEKAQAISDAALFAWVSIAAVVLIRKAV